MKIFKYLSLALVALVSASCEKHEITYNAETIASDCAMVQLHYLVPQSTGTAKNIYKIELDGTTLVNNSAAMMSVYGYTPGVTKYYTVKAGSVSLKLYQSSDMNLVYENTITGLQAGKKYQVVVHDFESAPVAIESTYTLKEFAEENVTENTAEYHYINFYNFMYEDLGVPYAGKLQYLCQYTMDWETGEKSEWLPVGTPVAFGESTGWIKLPVIKQTYNHKGTARVDYRIVDENGNDLEVINSKGTAYAAYSDYWTAFVGLHNHHFLKGFRSNKESVASVTQVKVHAQS